MLPLRIVETERPEFDEPVVELWRDDEFIGMVFWDGEESIVQIYTDQDGDVHDLETTDLLRVLDVAVRIVTPLDQFAEDEGEYLEAFNAGVPEGERQGCTGRVDPDSDGDGIRDSQDNCPTTPNPDQLPTDCDCPCFSAADIDTVFAQPDCQSEFICGELHPGQVGIESSTMGALDCQAEQIVCGLGHHFQIAGQASCLAAEVAHQFLGIVSAHQQLFCVGPGDFQQTGVAAEMLSTKRSISQLR